MRWRYLVGAVLGALLPLSFFVPFLLGHGLDGALFFRLLFANHISAFFAMDVLVSSVVLCSFVLAEGRRLKMGHLWVYVICLLLVGVSLALPLFLFVRSRKVERLT